MKLPRKKTENSTKPGSKHQLVPALTRLVATWRLFWQQRAKLMALAAVVVVPSTLIRAANEVTIDFSLVLFVAAVFAVLALINFCHNMAVASSLSVAKIYTQSSGRFLQALGVTLAQAVALLPGIFAAVLIVFVGGFNLSQWLYLPGLIILAFTLVGIASLSLAQFIVTCEDASIVGALRASWGRTKGNRIRLLGHFALILLIISAFSSAVFFVINLSAMLAASWLVQGAVSSVLIVIALPWFITYGYSIYVETK
jgi:hypothetical protein